MGAGGIVALLVALFFGKDYLGFFSQGGAGSRASYSGAQDPGRSAAPSPADDPDAELVEFINFVLKDIQGTWTELFPKQLAREYRPATLVLFTDAVDDSRCGYATAAIGPFYCSGDNKAYIDLSFYRALSDRFGAPGDFAQAYVLAHEIGHHIQNLLGTSGRVHREKRRLSEIEGNKLSVRLELQADCLAGVWAHSTNQRNILEEGDIEEGLRAAAAIGDDTLQRKATGTIAPESWTHGSSEQRVRWFKRGFETGKVAECDTFKVARL